MKKITLFFACLLTMSVLIAKAQYANMPTPVVAKNVAAYSMKKLSFSPDSRYVAAEYTDVEQKTYTTIVEIATGNEISPIQVDYPWKEVESTKYKVESGNEVYVFIGKSNEKYYGEFL